LSANIIGEKDFYGKDRVINNVDIGAAEFHSSTRTIKMEFDEKYTIENFILYKCYPNPFNPSTTISFKLTKSNYVKLSVMDIRGRIVGKILDEYKSPGQYRYTWDSNNMAAASGIYFGQLQVGSEVETLKLLLIR